MGVEVKICGIKSPDVMEAAAKGGARWVGLVFYPPSPRSLSVEAARELARMAPTGLRVVGLFVNPTDQDLDLVLGSVPLDMIQLHGGESPDRIAEIKGRFGVPVMKAFRIADADDLAPIDAYTGVVDRLLFDAKPPKNVAALPGGNGIAFDWTLLTGRPWPLPWMLSGGLTPETVAEAVRVTGAPAVDVSSGVEDRPGHKTPALVHSFLKNAAQA